MQQCGWALAHASSKVQNDKSVVLAALSTTEGEALQFASPVRGLERLFKCRNEGQDFFLLSDLKAPFFIKGVYSFVICSFALSFSSLFYSFPPSLSSLCTQALRDDAGVVLAALSGEGGAAFKHASTSLRANKPFVLAAARGCGDPYSVALFAAEALVQDHEFMAEVTSSKNVISGVGRVFGFEQGKSVGEKKKLYHEFMVEVLTEHHSCTGVDNEKKLKESSLG